MAAGVHMVSIVNGILLRHAGGSIAALWGDALGRGGAPDLVEGVAPLLHPDGGPLLAGDAVQAHRVRLGLEPGQALHIQAVLRPQRVLGVEQVDQHVLEQGELVNKPLHVYFGNLQDNLHRCAACFKNLKTGSIKPDRPLALHHVGVHADQDGRHLALLEVQPHRLEGGIHEPVHYGLAQRVPGARLEVALVVRVGVLARGEPVVHAVHFAHTRELDCSHANDEFRPILLIANLIMLILLI